MKITIKLETRDDGGLCVCSDDIPGLILSGSDPVKVMAAVWPAITVLNEHKQSAEANMRRLNRGAN